MSFLVWKLSWHRFHNVNNMKQALVFISGFMGTGKTAVGRALARRLRLRFYDSDAEIERRAKMSVARIFETKGEAHFRRLEKAVVRELSMKICVVSLGGGALLDAETARLVSSCSVALTCAEPELWRRLKPEAARRPLLAGGRAALRVLCRKRRGLYDNAVIRVSTTRRSPAAAAALIEKGLAARGFL